MQAKLTLPLLLLFLAGNISAQYKDYFTNETMRLDYNHVGNANEEHFAFDQMVNDGEWAGNKTVLIDELMLGKYFFEVQDPKSNKVIYSRGYSSIYGEWETTPEAKENWGSFHESLRFPWPKQNVNILIYKRNINNGFDPIWEYQVNPLHHRAFTAPVKDHYNTFDVVINGAPEKQVDIVVLGEGYAADDMGKFRKDAQRFADVLLNTEPFASFKEKFSIRAVETPAPHSGVNHPHQDIQTRSALSVTYGAFNSERYALGYDNKLIREASAAVPYEFTAILMNDSIYGGGGIYNLYITAAVDNAFQEYLFVHEFGHHFADLADEYYTSASVYEVDMQHLEPWELNVTANADAATIKWKDIVTPNTPIPTPWEKAKYDEHSIKKQEKRLEMRKAKVDEKVMEDFFIEKRAWDDELLSNMKYSEHIGAFEGAQYKSNGLYRSAANCIMFTRHHQFCPACQRGIKLIIEQYTK
ncbi:M64 family metallopeptidase [Carboxylicivirga sp. M1479]|uniref:M64 family metallopeptidase n=1 Tax=Carboxylicivirga sp. M1479 TaxID=2594476 RepID=UPI001178BDDB|nr:M64 family metallopeptidase [Carboxylicivirga sp. M1479]TRX66180.1 peptidase M64 [Carboxylicivirga sp. M1479]